MPPTCAWDTTAVADGTYDLRVVAVDAAGNTRTSATRSARILDNSGPAVAVTAPGMFRGTVTVNATASDPRGVASVAIQRSPGRRLHLDDHLQRHGLALLVQLELGRARGRRL